MVALSEISIKALLQIKQGTRTMLLGNTTGTVHRGNLYPGMILRQLFCFTVAFVVLFAFIEHNFMANHHKRRTQHLLLHRRNEYNRQLQSDYYYTTTDTAILGDINPEATIGNPFKGLLSSPDWTGTSTPKDLPTSLEFYYIGLDKIMIGNDQFNWGVLDKTLNDAANRHKHVIWRVYCHYPGRALAVPQYLMDQNVQMVGDSPKYDDPRLLEAFEQFIAALGSRYDGHKSLAFIQLGLLGYWGEWHTYPEKNLLPETVKRKVATWYLNAFQITKLQVRDPADVAGGSIGFHDDSFGYSTLGSLKWYFWPKVLATGSAENWKSNVMGGETRPELQSTIFEATYQAGSTENKQDFMDCVMTTHATYMIHSNAFNGGGYTGTELQNALFAHSRMGYNFVVTKVAAISPSANKFSVDVTVKQIGVAPFYYPLSLVWNCPGAVKTLGGVESVVDTNNEKIFRFKDLPMDRACLRDIKISLVSTFIYNERPIRFAQGDGTVSFSLPMLDESSSVLAPVAVPVPAPVAVPLPAPFVAPAPVKLPIRNSSEVHLATILTLFDADADTKIITMTNNMVINTTVYTSISVLAYPSESFPTGSVQFKCDGRVVRTENAPPYAVNGNTGRNIYPWKPSLGVHILTVTPFSDINAKGTAGLPEVITFTLVGKSQIQTKAPRVAPTSPTIITPSPVSDPKASSIVMTLVNADTDMDIGLMTNGMFIDLSLSPNVNVRADPTPSFPTKQVQFKYDGSIFRIESQFPYVLNGNSGADYHAWKPEIGNHTIEGTAFNGNDLLSSFVTFTVI